MNTPSLIKGGRHADHRGTIEFVNEMDMTPVKRFYIIGHPDTVTKRGWRGHRIEQRWFKALEGAFLIRLVKINDWKSPAIDALIDAFELHAATPEVLHIPPGYASLISATQENSKLLVFADYGLEHAALDDYVFAEDHFINAD